MINQILLQLGVLFLGAIIAGIKSIQRSVVEETNLDTHATAQQTEQITALLQLQQILESNLVLINIFLLIFLASSLYTIFQAFGLALVWLVAVNLLAGSSWVDRRAARLAYRHRLSLFRLAVALQPALKLIGNSQLFVLKRSTSFSSRHDLIEAIDRSDNILSKLEQKELRQILTSEHQSR